MAEFAGYFRYCLNTGKLLLLAVLVSGGVVLHVLASITYVFLPIPLLFSAGSEHSSLFSESDNNWVNASKFLSGASTVGSIAIPAILKHCGVISWGALAMELSSFFVFVSAIMCYMRMNDEDHYSIL
ncbi:vacuolar protein sorting-associated protein 55 homolog [Phaseolus vulgaris]|uniref:vacuolar protein sorting-associated protein 55 homolog n=1 Tax=Phaseolus vulgaris TaxID=3885 RepID=UPI0035CBC4FD